ECSIEGNDGYGCAHDTHGHNRVSPALIRILRLFCAPPHWKSRALNAMDAQQVVRRPGPPRHSPAHKAHPRTPDGSAARDSSGAPKSHRAPAKPVRQRSPPPAHKGRFRAAIRIHRLLLPRDRLAAARTAQTPSGFASTRSTPHSGPAGTTFVYTSAAQG